MSSQETIAPETHRRLAADLFNFVWTLLEKDYRTQEEDDTMVHAAHASRYHWEVVGTPLNFARGEWQISRVYSVLERQQPALYHAGRCLALCQEHDLGAFDTGYAYEALSRAAIISGDEENCKRYADLARECAEKVSDEKDRALLLADLDNVKPKT